MGQNFCFKTKDGQDVFLFTLKNSAGTEVHISNYGGIINKYIVRNEGNKLIDVVLGFDNMEDYFDEAYLTRYPYFGAIVGRYANRIANAAFSIDGKHYEVSKNNKTNQLHGGWEGFDRKIWNLVDHNDTMLQLEYVSADGEEGFPGTLQVGIRYELTESDEFSYEFTATTDQPTAVNLSHHSYFNLNGQGNILDHELVIHGNKVLEQDAERVATGNYLDVKQTSFDFTKPSIIKSVMDLNEGIDHSYLVDNEDTSKPAAVLRSLQSNLQLQLWTAEPVVHFYAGKGLPAYRGKNNEIYGDYAGMCLETQVHPNAVNIPSFPNTILRPGETYNQKTIYKVSLIDEK